MSDQIQDTGKQVTSAAESAVAQVKDQAEAVLASVAASEKLANAKKQARKVQKQAAKRSHELGEEAAVRGKAAAKQASKEAKKRGNAAVAGAPVVAAAAREKARKKGGQALEVAREKGGEALLIALDSDAGKRLAATGAGTALKSKLTARKRRRRKLLALIAGGAGGAVAFKQLRAKRAASVDTGDSTPFATPPAQAPVEKLAAIPPTETIAPGAVGTAAGDPVAGLVKESVEKSPEVADQTEKPAVTATEDGELHTDAESS